MEALIASLQEILKLSDAQTAVLMSDFESRLPKYLQNALHLVHIPRNLRIRSEGTERHSA
jgi:hypothetical protein